MDRIMSMLQKEFRIRQRCRVVHETSNAADWMLYLLLGFVPLCGIGMFLFGLVIFFVCLAEGGHPAACLLLMAFSWGIGFFLCHLGWIGISAACADYTVDAGGIRVKYPLEREIDLPWDAFQEVCVTYVGRSNTIPAVANSAICFIRHGEKKNLFGRWKTDEYYHFRSCIAMDYTPERLQAVRELCPYPVPDCRGKGNDRL